MPYSVNEQGYYGSFGGHRVGGQGVTAALLTALRIAVFSENEIEHAAAYVAALEAT